MKKKIFTGVGVALVTPFTGEFGEKVNYEKLEELVEFEIKNGVDAIVICATTGEASVMPDEEHLATAKCCIDAVAKRVPVIVGAGSNDTLHAIKLTKECEKMGADGVLSVTPYYNKTTQEGLYRHYSAIAAKTDIPIVLYNVPGRTNLNINPETYARLSKIPNINAVKECNMSQVYETIKLCGDDLNIYSGEDGQVFYPTLCGGDGVISVVANFAPKYMHDIVMLAKEGKVKEALELQIGVLDLVKAMFCEVNPMPVKEAMNQLGFGVGPCRMPLCDISDAHKALVAEELKKFGLKTV